MKWWRQQSFFSLYIFAAVISLLLSCAGYWRSDVINNDGLCYLQSALTFKTENLSNAMSVCGQAKWPLYSILIAAVHTVTHASLPLSAYLLNAMFSLISVMSFMYLVSLLGGNFRTVALAAFTILIAHQFNSVREYIIRDHGFWAFYLLSIIFFVKYLQRPGWTNCLGWSIAILVATLFRIEGALFLVLMPFVVLLQKQRSVKQRLMQFAQLNSLLLVAVGAVLLGSHSLSANKLSRLNDLQYQMLHGFSVISTNFKNHASVIAQNVLNGYSERDAYLLLFLMVLLWFVLNVISNVSWVFAGVLAWGLFKTKSNWQGSAKLVVISYLLINVLMTVLFLFEYMFLSKRYLIGLSLLLMLWVPFVLNSLWNQKPRWMVQAVLLLALVTSLGGIFDFGYSKKYLSEAGSWLAINIKDSKKLYSNDLQVLYYSQKYPTQLFKIPELQLHEKYVQQHFNEYDYLALRSLHKEPFEPEINPANLGSVKTFSNKRGDKVTIYKVIH